MRSLAPDWQIDSAGTGGWHVGEPPYPPMQAAAKRQGIDISDLRARQFRQDDFDRFDLIVAMDRKNLHDIEAVKPCGHKTPVRLFADQDVPDPYYTRDFDGVLAMIRQAAVNLLADTSAQRSL